MGTLGRTAWIDQSCLGHPSVLIHPRSIFFNMKFQMTLMVKPWESFIRLDFSRSPREISNVRRLDLARYEVWRSILKRKPHKYN